MYAAAPVEEKQKRGRQETAGSKEEAKPARETLDSDEHMNTTVPYMTCLPSHIPYIQYDAGAGASDNRDSSSTVEPARSSKHLVALAYHTPGTAWETYPGVL